MFRIGLFIGVTLFIYLILDINFKKISKGIREWIIYMKEIELPKQKVERTKVVDKIKLWLHTYEVQGDMYIDKFKLKFGGK